MDQKKIGQLISKIRKEKNMTQKELADKLGVTDRAISKWENGRGLPDLSLIQPLCKILGITINEFLNGERIDKSQVANVAERNMLSVLEDRNDEIKKHKRLKIWCSLILILIIVFSGARIGLMLFAGFGGEGYSVSCAVNTEKAEWVAEYIVNGEYQKAAKYISFNKEHQEAEKEWCENMKALENEIYIEYMDVSKIILDDYFPVGNVVMIVNDRKGIEYIFKLQVTIQNGDIAFGGIHIDNLNQDNRREEVAYLIDNALSTWNPG